jgi:hypothetical protein
MAMAMAAPMPREEPVTRAFLPVRRKESRITELFSDLFYEPGGFEVRAIDRG